MSRLTDEIFSAAETSSHGLITGDPDEPCRQEWSEIHSIARRMAGTFAEAGIGPGTALAILAGLPADIAPACQAGWMRGASITMLHQPTPRTDLAAWAQDTETVLATVRARAVVVGPPFDAAAPILAQRGIQVVTVEELRAGTGIDPLPTVESDIALQQLTSGSTGSPKAVQITHANLYANAYAMFDRVEYQTERDVLISWLPLFHDMGMVGFLSAPMQFGAEAVCVMPLEFLRNPMLWAELITKYRGTVTAGPNFAYAMLARRLAQADSGAVDLSSMRYMMNGAEPVDPDTVTALATAGRRFGLDPAALTSVYGMAESTLAVSLPEPARGQQLDIVDAGLLEALGKAVPVDPARRQQGPVRRLPTLGYPVDGMTLRVVDGRRVPQPARTVGAIEIRGPAVTSGYLTPDGFVAAQDAEGWLHTGDQGYLTEDGLVVVCGRVKDVIIMGGRNIYPTDIERAALRVHGVRPGNAVAVRIDAGRQRESFAVVVESNDHADPAQVKRIERAVVHEVFTEVGARPRSVTVLGPGTLPKTSSGKVRRAATAHLSRAPRTEDGGVDAKRIEYAVPVSDQ